jgi:hypothetical protein
MKKNGDHFTQEEIDNLVENSLELETLKSEVEKLRNQAAKVPDLEDQVVVLVSKKFHYFLFSDHNLVYEKRSQSANNQTTQR